MCTNVVMGSHDVVTMVSHDKATGGSHDSVGQTLHRTIFITDVVVLHLL